MSGRLQQLNRMIEAYSNRAGYNCNIEDTLFTDICIYGKQAILDEVERAGKYDVLERLKRFLIVEVAERELQKDAFEIIEKWLKENNKP